MGYEYRRAVRSRVWHWKPACTDYPAKNFEITEAKPLTGSLCSQCAAGATMVEDRREEIAPDRKSAAR